MKVVIPDLVWCFWIFLLFSYLPEQFMIHCLQPLDVYVWKNAFWWGFHRDLSRICLHFSMWYIFKSCSPFFFFPLSLTLEAYFVIFRAVDHQWDGGYFATAGAQVDIWNQNRYSSQLLYYFFSFIQGAIFQLYFENLPLVTRSQPVRSFEWGSDTVISVRFNPGEPNLLVTSGRYACWLLG